MQLKWDTEIKGLTKRELNKIGWEIFYYCRNVLKMKPRGNVYPYLHIYPRKKYIVARKGGSFTCTCPASMFQKFKECKHIVQVKNAA